ncbi:MAG TPA: hypothetical protein VGE45_18665 [Chloroflexia bacterium]|jgi:DNA-directed RNA polymerase specialized sigma24 family protein
MSQTSLLEQVNVLDFNSPDYLGEECLVYLIREFKRCGNRVAETALTEALVKRFAKKVNLKLQSLGPELLEQAFHDVVSILFSYILDIDSDAGDYLQVRFWVFLRRRQITVFNDYVRQIKEVQNTVPLHRQAGNDDGGQGDDSEYAPSTSRVSAARPSAPQITPEMRIIYRDGLNSIPQPQRTAFILRYYMGMEVESTDPSVPTISDYFRKSARTIYNWLEKAEQALEKWRGER